MTASSSKPAPAKAHEARSLVEYQEGAIVSRTLKDSPAGTVTVFAFDTGQALSEHTAPYDAFALMLDGVCVFTIGGKEARASAGEFMLMPANAPHALRAVERFKMMLVMIRSS